MQVLPTPLSPTINTLYLWSIVSNGDAIVDDQGMQTRKMRVFSYVFSGQCCQWIFFASVWYKKSLVAEIVQYATCWSTVHWCGCVDDGPIPIVRYASHVENDDCSICRSIAFHSSAVDWVNCWWSQYERMNVWTYKEPVLHKSIPVYDSCTVCSIVVCDWL